MDSETETAVHRAVWENVRGRGHHLASLTVSHPYPIKGTLFLSRFCMLMTHLGSSAGYDWIACSCASRSDHLVAARQLSLLGGHVVMIEKHFWG